MAPNMDVNPPADTLPCHDVPVSRLRLAVLAVFALALGIASTFGFERLLYERLPATYEAGLFNISADRPGRIEALLVPQGTFVEHSQPLLTLSDDALDDQIARREAQLQVLQSQLAAIEARVDAEMEAARRSIEREMFETRLRSTQFLQQRFVSQLEKAAWDELSHQPAAFATRTFDENDWIAALRAEAPQQEEFRVRALLRKGTASNAEEVAESQLALCEERLKELAAALSELPSRRSSSPELRAAAESVTESRNALELLKKQKPEFTVVADQAGIVGVYRHGPGDRVGAGETLVQVVDDSQRFVQLKIDSSRMNDFSRGKVFDLTFSNGVSGRGRVVEVQPQADAKDGSVPQLVVRLEQAGAAWPKLPFGSAVEIRRKRQ